MIFSEIYLKLKDPSEDQRVEIKLHISINYYAYISNVAWSGLTSLDMGDKRPPQPTSKYFSEIFSQSHIKLTNNTPNKDFKSVKRP